MIKKGFSYIGIYFLYGMALLPLPVLYLLSSLTYYLLYVLIGYRKTVVRENLKNSFPEKNHQEILSIERRYYRYLCDLIFEIVKMPLISKAELCKRYKFRNLEHMQSNLNKGKSAIICSAHYGNWEWGMLALGLHLPAVKYVIYKPVNNEVFERWFYNMRSRFGNSLVTMKQTMRSIIETKNITTSFCFAADQTPVKSSANHWINFLHQPTMVFSGPEKIAVQTNRPVFYLKVTVIKRGYYEVDCIQIADQPAQTASHEITTAQFKILEDNINATPQYWLWSHRRWKHKPEER